MRKSDVNRNNVGLYEHLQVVLHHSMKTKYVLEVRK